jgi:predicted acylesterase/phospholipase RssA
MRKLLAQLLLFLAIAIAAVNCGPPERPERSMKELLAARQQDDAALAATSAALVQKLVDNTKHKQDQSNAAAALNPTTAPTTRPTIDILVISGGGDWGAFGAGVLKGWGCVRGDLARPHFDVVTGVSTGALIAPFAFLGDDESIEKIEHFYRNPRSDWAQSRGVLFFLPNNPSFYSLPGLERDLESAVDIATLKRIVAVGDAGHELVVNTTNVDFGDIHQWDIVDASRAAVAANDPEKVRQILLASAGVPGIFPARNVGDSLYVDGAVTSNILYGGRIKESDSFWAKWQNQYPNDPLPRIRYWVIFNNQMRFPPQVTAIRWPDIISRAETMATQSATVNSMRHLFAIAEIAKLKRGADIEVRILAVPDDWIPQDPGVFVKSVMNNLADIGEKLGADPSSWRTESP